MPNVLDQIMVKMGFDTTETSKVTDAMNKVSQETKKGESALEGFNVKGREGHELLRKIGEQSPIVGSALKAAFSPESAGIVALIAALGWVFEQFEKVREKIKKLGEDAGQMWLDIQSSQSEAARRVDDYQRELDKATEALSRQNDKYKEQIELIDRILSGHMEVMSAIDAEQKKQTSDQREKRDQQLNRREQAALDAAKTPQQKEAIRQQFEQTKENLKKQDEYQDTLQQQRKHKQDADAKHRAEEAKIQATHQELQKTGFEQAAAQDAVDKAKKSLASAAAHEPVQKANERAMSELEEKIKDLTGKAANAESLSQQGGLGGLLSKAAYEAGVLKEGYTQGNFSKAMDENTVSGLKKQLADAQNEYNQRKATNDRLAAQSKSADEAAKEAAGRKERADAKAQALNQQKQQMKAEMAEQDDASRKAGAAIAADVARQKAGLAPVSGGVDMFGRPLNENGQPLYDMFGRPTGLPTPNQSSQPDPQKDAMAEQTDYLRQIRDALDVD